MKWFELSKNFMDESFGKVDPHFVQAVYWLKFLEPKASEELQVAAYSHDIERAFKKSNRRSKAFLLDQTALEKHQRVGGQIIYDFLIKNKAPEDFAKKVKNLIARHEWGGDSDQNLLKDADSLSYFEINAPQHVYKTDEFSIQEIKDKFAFMYNRISSDKAKKIAKPMYESALKLVK